MQYGDNIHLNRSYYVERRRKTSVWCLLCQSFMSTKLAPVKKRKLNEPHKMNGHKCDIANDFVNICMFGNLHFFVINVIYNERQTRALLTRKLAIQV